MDFTTAGNIGIIQRCNYGTLNAGIRKDLLNKRLTLNLQGMDLLDTFRQKGIQYSAPSERHTIQRADSKHV